MKEYGGIQSPFDDAIVPVPGGKGDNASSDPGVPVRDAPAATSSVVGPLTQTVKVRDDTTDPQTAGKSIKGS